MRAELLHTIERLLNSYFPAADHLDSTIQRHKMLFINKMPSGLLGTYKVYADDVRRWYSISSEARRYVSSSIRLVLS